MAFYPQDCSGLCLSIADGSASGFLLMNSNAMDVVVTEEAISFRIIGGILDFHFFGGPTPAAVMEQFTRLVGRPKLPPFWSLGFHQCKWVCHSPGMKSIMCQPSLIRQHIWNPPSLQFCLKRQHCSWLRKAARLSSYLQRNRAAELKTAQAGIRSAHAR